MNRHVRRVEARHRRDRLDSFLAACVAVLFIGLCLGRASAQDFTPPISNGTFQANSFSGNTNAGAVTQAIVAPSGQWAYLCGWVVYSNGATAAAEVNVTITGLQAAPGVSQTFTYPFAITTVGTSFTNTSDKYWPCLRSAVIGGSIVVNVPQSAGNTSTLINMYGFTGQ